MTITKDSRNTLLIAHYVACGNSPLMAPAREPADDEELAGARGVADGAW